MINPTYPGLYIQEMPNPVKTIVGASTSVTAFIGWAKQGPVAEAIRVFSFPEYQGKFGDLDYDSTMSYSVYQYFLNGGREAIIVRVADNAATPAKFVLNDPGFILLGKTPGDWANHLLISIEHKDDDDALIDILVQTREDPDDAASDLITLEIIRNVSADNTNSRYVVNVLETESQFLTYDDETLPTVKPNAQTFLPEPGTKSGELNDLLIKGDEGVGIDSRRGIKALDTIQTINMVVIPPLTFEKDVENGTYDYVAGICEKKRAILFIDPNSSWKNYDTYDGNWPTDSTNTVRFFPRILCPDPKREMKPREFAPSGAMAGIFARTDAQIGVWKAPAGVNATIKGISGLTVPLSDNEIGQLNPLAVNCLKNIPLIGDVVWGARTTKGKDVLSSQWKYIPVRRTALFIEQTLERQLQWTVFKGNDYRLWSQIRTSVGSFMHNLFKQGAFQGANPSDAYRVKCDNETTTPYDIQRGIVNVIVAFKPLMVAEFVVIKIQQIVATENGT